jgi:peptidoglycan hydrolase-like protein with peptidoglycan-binding domain
LAAGFDPGPIDGVIRTKTMRAVNEFQTSKGLPVDAYLNLPTVKALGVKPS